MKLKLIKSAYIITRKHIVIIKFSIIFIKINIFNNYSTTKYTAETPRKSKKQNKIDNKIRFRSHNRK
ncbi:hypothetical protein C5470_12755 [Photorhabdus stackebrandtii]|uniref:Uncharacterized protein n=1 Tax=Photorhabdus stackebrandtii TaxID=1123042 RepID=A0A7X5QMY5_9GAMM|nr:hypothetical protein [Photorhabdus stackebrandtii]